MHASERFLGVLAKLRKTHRTHPPQEQAEAIRAAFSGALRHLPPGMVEDMFERFSPERTRGAADPGDTSLFDGSGRLADTVDVLCEEYDSGNDPLGREEWAALGEITSEYAPDLDMRLVSYVMGLVVDHHGM